MHLSSNMLIQQLLPNGSKVRRSFSFRQGEKSFINRFYRTIIDRSLTRRHVLTDYFFSLAHHLTLDRLERVMMLANEANVELMVHPHVSKEYDFLMGDGYGEALSHVSLEGFDSLESKQ